MTASEFKPQFNPTVGVIGPGANGIPAQFTPINPIYCATPQCAQDLASVLADLKPKIVLRMPFGPWPAGPFNQTLNVPWFQFQDAAGNQYLANAGLLASYWTHGFPPNFAELQARGDVALGLAQTAIGNN